MSWARSGDLICDCCGKIVIRQEEVNKKDLKENTGQTICNECFKTWAICKPETD